MFQPEIRTKKYDSLIMDIEEGYIKIPQFQRDFIWSKEQTAALIDSIIKGFPIGTFILWRTREELRTIKDIGNFNFPDTPKGEFVTYVLDGQQRITSLYAVKKGIRVRKDGEDIDYKDISINLKEVPNHNTDIVTVDPPENESYISVHNLLNASIKSLVKNYNDEELDKIELYKKHLTGYDFSTVVIKDYPIDTACEIFTRINTAGKVLTLFEIMVAKTFDPKQKFDLLEEYEWLIDNKGKEKDLEDAGFDTIPASTVIQCIAAHICKQVRRRDILKLKKSKVIKEWPIVKNGIFHAVDYFRRQLRIPVSQLLPYNALLVPFSYFFIKNNFKNPIIKQNKLLTQYFWWASLSNRFSSGVEGKIATDLTRMDDILKCKRPDYKGEEINLSLSELKYRWFSTGDAFCKAILCLYAYHQPKSFEDNGLVKIDNSWLKIVNSKNYHHFFPRSYLKNKGYKNWESNVILNITIVNDDLNKRIIGSKAPKVYMKKFNKKNPELSRTLKSHLIGNLNKFGIMDNDYETFLKQRGKRVLKEINNRLHPN